MQSFTNNSPAGKIMFTSKLLILFFCLTSLQQASGQTLYIQNGKKKIEILLHARLEVLTYNDTTAFSPKKDDNPFLISRITHDSIELSRVITWKDTFSYKFNVFTGKDNKDKIRHEKIAAQVEYKTYALNDISGMRYTYQRDQSGDGCPICILIPGLNIYYFWSKGNRTKNFETAKWTFVWK